MKFIKIIYLIIFYVTYLNASGYKLYFAGKEVNLQATNKYDSKLKWLEIKVPTNDGKFKTFQVMSRPVTKEDFFGFGSEIQSVDNIDFESANNFCVEKYNALPIDVYVFEEARKNKNFSLSKNLKYEMISPVDYEELDEIFYKDGDHLEVGEGLNLIIFNNKNQTYHPKSIAKKPKNTSFRCMRY